LRQFGDNQHRRVEIGQRRAVRRPVRLHLSEWAVAQGSERPAETKDRAVTIANSFFRGVTIGLDGTTWMQCVFVDCILVRHKAETICWGNNYERCELIGDGWPDYFPKGDKHPAPLPHWVPMYDAHELHVDESKQV
jgi:hypothetical protein